MVNLIWLIEPIRFADQQGSHHLNELISAYQNLAPEQRPPLILVTATGMGSALADLLQERGLPAVACPVNLNSLVPATSWV